jgi:DNA invertase Pin-like site-specific DNA recombinase
MRVNHAAVGDPEAVAVAVERQRELCLAFAAQRGLRVVDVYLDTGGAARVEQRPALQRLLAELPATHASFVIISDLARVSRQVRDLTTFEQRLSEAGVELLVWGEDHLHVELRRRMSKVLTASGEELRRG